MEFVKLNSEVQDDAAILQLVSDIVQPFYEPRLPYHNWDEHITGGLELADRICDDAQAADKPVNRLMLKIAYLGHDAGFSHDLINPDIWNKYGNKEGYSAYIMQNVLEMIGMDEEFIDGVKTCINFTAMESTLPEGIDDEIANTAIATRMTDLANIFGSYKGFIVSSFKLMEEDRIYGRERTLKDFKKTTRFVLSSYLGTDMLPGNTCRSAEAFGNIDRFMRESPSKLLRALGSYASRFGWLLNKQVTSAAEPSDSNGV